MKTKKQRFLFKLVTGWLFLCAVLSGCTFVTPSASSAGEMANISFLNEWIKIEGYSEDVLFVKNLVLQSNMDPFWDKRPGTHATVVWASNIENGKIVWERAASPVAPLAANSQYVFVVEKSKLRALDLNTGEETWVNSLSIEDREIVQTYGDEELILVADRETLSAFNSSDGKLQWKFGLPAQLDFSAPPIPDFSDVRAYSALTRYEDTVYARVLSSYRDNRCVYSLLALNAQTGEKIWHFSINEENNGECIPETFPQASGDDVLLLGIRSDALHCTLTALDEETGNVMWNRQFDEVCIDFKAVFSGGNFVFPLKEKVMVLDAQTGNSVVESACPEGWPGLLLADYDEVICRSWEKDAGQWIFSLFNFRSGKIVKEELFSAPEICESRDLFGIADDKLWIMEGSCVKPITVTETGMVTP